MALPFNTNLKPFARALPKNMTDAEHALWSNLRRRTTLTCGAAACRPRLLTRVRNQSYV